MHPQDSREEAWQSRILMKRTSRIAIWPFVCIATCLLVLTLISPRAWQALPSLRFVKQQPAPPAPAEPVENGFTPNRTLVVAAVESLAADAMNDFFPAPQAAKVRPPVADRAPALIMPRLTAPELPSKPPRVVDQGEASEGTPAPVITIKQAASPSAAVPRQSIAVDPIQPRCWPRPLAVIAQLDRLAEEIDSRDWALSVLETLQAIGEFDSLASTELPQHFQRLEELIEDANAIDERLESLLLRSELRKTVYGLIKRLQVWRQVNIVAANGAIVKPIEHDDARMLQIAALVVGRLRPLPDAVAWHRFLLLERVGELAREANAADQRQRLATILLTRLESPQLTDAQQQFLAADEFSAYKNALRHWIIQPVDLSRLLHLLEQRELRGGPADAQQFAESVRALRWSPREEIVELGDLLEAHYRNANVRVAVSVDLINRLLPAPPPRSREPVNDQISGARIRGASEAATERFLIRLFPDRHRLRMGFEARGLVASETSAHSGPVRFFNEGLAMFRVRKQFLVDRRGIKTQRSETEAHSDATLTGLETEWDGFPLVGMLVRSIALQQHDQQAGMAKSVVEQKLEERISRQLDEHVQQKLMTAERRLQEKVLLPLRKLDLDPVPVDMQTTAQRLIVRYRLAGDDQLSAHTPRPQAPGGSLMSMQMHESIVNNAIEKLKLAGRRSTIEEVVREVAAAMGRDEIELPEDFPGDIVVEFAADDPLRVEFQDGSISLKLRISELAGGPGRWHDFSVEVKYSPEAEGLDMRLSRSGDSENVILIDSLEPDRRLTLGDRIVLRSIFTKVLSKNRKLPLMPAAVKDGRAIGRPARQPIRRRRRLDRHGTQHQAGSHPTQRPTAAACRRIALMQ